MKTMKGIFTLLMVAFLFVGMEAQSFTFTKRYSNERGGVVYEFTQTVWDTINAQSGTVTAAIPFPFRTYGEWGGSAWIEIDTLALNIVQQAGTFAIQSAAHTTLGLFETCLSANPAATASMAMPSPTATLGDIVPFRVNGPRAQALATVTDGVIRYKWGITIWPLSQSYVSAP